MSENLFAQIELLFTEGIVSNSLYLYIHRPRIYTFKTCFVFVNSRNGQNGQMILHKTDVALQLSRHSIIHSLIPLFFSILDSLFSIDIDPYIVEQLFDCLADIFDTKFDTTQTDDILRLLTL